MNRRFALAFLLGSLSFIGATTADAQTITAVTSPSWGTVEAPNTGSTSYSLSATSGIVAVLSGLGFVFGDGYAGTYLLSGTPLKGVSYSVSIGSFTGTGVSVTSAFIGGSTSSGTGTLSVLGTLTLGIGGVLLVSAGATAGTHTATVTVTVNFS